jgi:hypothetical protein
MLERLVILIHEYQARVLEAAALFQKYKGIDPLSLMYWRQSGLAIEGFIDPERSIEYGFHGIGCWVNLPSGEVDWDFGQEGRLDGFDAWRLWRFAEDGTDKFPEFKRKETLDEAFSHAVAHGIICAPFKGRQDNLYYLRSDVVSKERRI